MTPRYQTRLILDDLTLSRGERPLIDALSLHVEPGQALWLTGPNGIGKTTLLLGCAGLLSPDSGSITWSQNGHLVPAHHALSYAAHTGPERAGLTLGQELSFWQALAGDRSALTERLREVGLETREQTPISGLSAGQRRRLSLARLRAADRAAWLLDEPLAGLDAQGRRLVTDLLSDHLARGGIALIASHQPIPIDGVEASRLVLEPGS